MTKITFDYYLSHQDELTKEQRVKCYEVIAAAIEHFRKGASRFSIPKELLETKIIELWGDGVEIDD